jgi:hypothetical protein
MMQTSRQRSIKEKSTAIFWASIEKAFQMVKYISVFQFLKLVHHYLFIFDMQSAFHYSNNYSTVLTISSESYELASRISPMATFMNQSNQSDLTVRLFDLIKSLSEDEQISLLRELEEKISRGKRKHERKPFFIVIPLSHLNIIRKEGKS